MKWYADKYRRHLADMHIEDWNEEFLSKLNVDAYVHNLKTGNIQTAMIYMQSHVGLCNFPTKTSRMHKAYEKENKMQKLMNKCKEEGISVVGYYSLIYNNEAYLSHPEWRMINERGKTAVEEGQRYGLVCPNNPEYRAFLVEQIQEFFAVFDKLDGVFHDMPFWPLLCTCKSCKERFRRETGKEIPQKDWKDPTWRLYVEKRQDWMTEFSEFVTRETKKVRQGVTVSQNFAGVIAFGWWAGSTEGIGDACDYVGGDLYGDIYAHSFSCKYYHGATKNPPFEYMLGSCESDLNEHTVTKTESKLATEVFLTAAHHGATMIIDAVDPVGTFNPKRYERIGKVFREEEKYEPYLTGEYVGDVGVYYDSKSNFSPEGYGYTNKNCAINLVKTFVENKVAVSVLSNNHFGDLSKYKMIFAPCLQSVGNKEIPQLIEYVKNGGALYLSSVSDKELLKEFFGGEITGLTKETKTYLRPTAAGEEYFEEFEEEYPMSVNYALPLIETDDKAEVLARLTLPYTLPQDNVRFASIHSDPPGIKTERPVVLRTKYGKGQVVWSAAAIENESRPLYKKTIMNFLYGAVGKENLFVEARANTSVEIVSFREKDFYTVSLVDLDIQEEYESKRYKLGLKIEARPTKVTIVPTGEEVEFSYKNGRVYLCGEFEKFRMLKIEC